MTRRPKDIGTAAESAVVKVLRDNGFPHAERRALRGTLDCGDVTGTPGVVWEVKGGEAARSASDNQIDAWVRETERERMNAGADVGVLVVQRRGVGAPNAGNWWAVLPVALLDSMNMAVGLRNSGGWFAVRMRLADVILLLKRAGYGDPLP